MPRYGERFRQIREAKGLTTTQVAVRLFGKEKNQGTVSGIEASARVPRVETILKHAAALSCRPSELMTGVETVYDEIRAGKYDGRQPKVFAAQLARETQHQVTASMGKSKQARTGKQIATKR